MNKVTVFRLSTKIFSSLMLATITGGLLSMLFISLTEKHWAAILIQCLLLLLYYSVIYSAAWKDGYTEMNRVLCGFSTFDPLKGLKAGLLAVVPSYLLWGLMVALRYFGVELDTAYRIVHFFAIHVINAFMNPDVRVQDLSFGSLLGASSFLAAVPLVTFVGYLLGYKRFSFMELFVFKKKAQPANTPQPKR